MSSSSIQSSSATSTVNTTVSLQRLMYLAGFNAACMSVMKGTSIGYPMYGYTPSIVCSEDGWVDDPEGVFQALLGDFGLNVVVELMKRSGQDYIPENMPIDSVQVISVLNDFFEE